MTDQPTPETDAEMSYRPPTAQPWYVPYEFARALEIQRNASSAERDELNRQLSVALKGKRPYSAEFADETIAAQVKRIAELEEKLNGWFSERNAARADVARLRTALEGMLIAEMEVRQMDGSSADEVETEPHWMAARAALAERDRLKADITGDIADMTLSLTAERDALRADATQLRDVLQRIVSNGGSATNVMRFDARTALAQ